MEIFKHKRRGSIPEVGEEAVVDRDHRQTRQALRTILDDNRLSLYNQADSFRKNKEYDKAAAAYELIINEDNSNADAHWSVVLCRYGVEYEEELSSHKHRLKLNRIQLASVLDDENYKAALQYADSHQRRIYEEEGKAILEILERRKKTARIITSIVATVAVLAILLNTVFAPFTQYFYSYVLMKTGRKAEAAIRFAKAGDFLDSKAKAAALWDEIAVRETVAAGSGYAAGLKIDGTPVADGNNYSSQRNVYHWRNIVAVSVGDSHTVGLKADGTVVATGWNRYRGCNVSTLRNIVAIDAGERHTIGLKADGTVVAVGDTCFGQHRVSEWTDIIAVSAGGYHTVGLKVDGSVVATGMSEDGQCNVSEWKDMIAISAGQYHTVGLKEDGTVVATGKNKEGQCDVAGWTGIVAVSAGNNYTLGLKADGTVVAVGDNWFKQCNVSNWTQIVAISAGYDYSVGLKADGTAVAVGYYDGGRDPSCWKDIKIP